MPNLKDFTTKHTFETSGDNRRDIQLSCLMRIADATELIAENYRQLLKDLEDEKSRTRQYERLFREERIEKEALQRSITAHKANYTRLKRKFESK